MLRSTRTLLALAAACFAAFWALLAVVYLTGPGRWVDSASLHGFASVQRPVVNEVTKAVAHLADPVPYGLLGGALVALALARGRRTRALAVLAVLGGSAVSSQLLKPLLAHTRPHDFPDQLAAIDAAAYPSGHATAAMALALCAVLVAPPARRRAAALAGAAFALAVSFAIVSLGWHFPSDVLGGFLVAATWSLGALAAVRRIERRTGAEARAERRRAARARPAAALPAELTAAALAAGVALGLTAAHAHALAGYAERHTAAVVVAAGISAVAAALVAAVAAAARR